MQKSDGALLKGKTRNCQRLSKDYGIGFNCMHCDAFAECWWSSMHYSNHDETQVKKVKFKILSQRSYLFICLIEPYTRWSRQNIS